MVHDIPKSLSKTLNEKTKFRISGLVGLLGTSGVIGSRFIDDKLWKYSILGWSLIGLGTCIFGMYKTMGYDTKIRLTKFCNKLGSYFI